MSIQRWDSDRSRDYNEKVFRLFSDFVQDSQEKEGRRDKQAERVNRQSISRPPNERVETKAWQKHFIIKISSPWIQVRWAFQTK